MKDDQGNLRPTDLIDVQVAEVSTVDAPAIVEEFAIVKSESGTADPPATPPPPPESPSLKDVWTVVAKMDHGMETHKKLLDEKLGVVEALIAGLQNHFADGVSKETLAGMREKLWALQDMVYAVGHDANLVAMMEAAVAKRDVAKGTEPDAADLAKILDETLVLAEKIQKPATDTGGKEAPVTKDEIMALIGEHTVPLTKALDEAKIREADLIKRLDEEKAASAELKKSLEAALAAATALTARVEKVESTAAPAKALPADDKTVEKGKADPLAGSIFRPLSYPVSSGR